MPIVNKGQTPTILWHCCGAESSDAGRLHRTAIGTSHSWHLWCERHRLVVVFPCGWWEREAERIRLRAQAALLPRIGRDAKLFVDEASGLSR